MVHSQDFCINTCLKLIVQPGFSVYFLFLTKRIENMYSGSVLTRGRLGEVQCGHVFRFSRNNFENAYWNIVDTTYTEVFGMGFFFLHHMTTCTVRR